MTTLLQTLRSRWFAALVHVALWLLVYLAAIRFGGKAPGFRDSVALSAPAQNPAPVAKLEKLFAPGIWPKISAETNATPLFLTRHFIPTPPPPPPPPTTKKIEITYQGYFETQGSARQVMVKLADAYVVKPVGAHIATNWVLAAASMQTLVLTNTSAQTNVLPLNVKKEIEVPIP